MSFPFLDLDFVKSEVWKLQAWVIQYMLFVSYTVYAAITFYRYIILSLQHIHICIGLHIHVSIP